MMKYLFIVFCVLIFASCREDVIEPVETAKFGKLILNSNPAGAEIIFDNFKTGKITPDSLVNIQPGNYTVKLNYFGFEELRSISIVPGQTRYISVTFYYE
jgi:hypothetical protein